MRKRSSAWGNVLLILVLFPVSVALITVIHVLPGPDQLACPRFDNAASSFGCGFLSFPPRCSEWFRQPPESKAHALDF